MQAEEFVERAFGSRGPRTPSIPWLDDLRAVALAHFKARGLPGPDEEDWRGTSLDALTSTPFRAYEREDASWSPADIEPWGEGIGPTGAALVMVNGRVEPVSSHHRTLASQVEIGSLVAAVARKTPWIEPLFTRLAKVEDDPFQALNTAVFEDGVILHVPRGLVVPVPIVIRHVAVPGHGPLMCSPRILVSVEAGAEATIVESFEGGGALPWLTNVVAEVDVGRGARLNHVKLQREGEQGFHISNTSVRLHADARLRAQSLILGGGLTRQSLQVEMCGPGAEADLDGLYVPRGRQHVDVRTTVDHRVPHTASRQLYKGVLDERSRGLFTGKVMVRPGAQKTDARQMNQNLVISGTALVDSKPQLEIYADDVTCKHGSTTGRLSDDALFYLRSRGVDEREARSILSFAFAREVVERVSEPVARAIAVRELGRRWPGSETLMEG